MVPATPDESTCVVETGSQTCGSAYSRHCDSLWRGTLRIGEVSLPDLLPDGANDALPANHRAKAQRNGHRDLDSQRDDAERDRATGDQHPQEIERARPHHREVGIERVRINNGRHRIGRVMKAIHELSSQRDQKRNSQ